MNVYVCFVMIIAKVMLLRDFEPYGIIFITRCILYFSVILDG